jgi:undecaprenyl-phosphate 4-deoxy-4-formamido-L-arabinose transferase
MTSDKNIISIVTPAFNEEKNLDELISRCVKTCRGIDCRYEIIMVDDGSKDRSGEIIREAARNHPGIIKGVILNRNYGQHAAVLAGFEQACGDIVITLDADLQNPPEEIPNLIRHIDQGFDVVGTVRENRQDSLFRKISSYVVNKSIQKVTGVRMTDYGCMLRAYRKHIVEAVLQCSERSTFIPVLANSFAGATTEISVRHAERKNGDSKYNFLKLLSLQFDLLTSMTTFPLRLLSIVGGILSCFGIGFGGFLMMMRLMFGSVWAANGIFTLFSILFVLIGSQFFALGLLGEYIGRIYNDVRARPRYHIQDIVFEKKTSMSAPTAMNLLAVGK